MALNEISSQLKSVFGSMSSAKLFTLMFLISITVAGFIFLMAWSGNPDFRTLYSNLSPEDAGAIITRLKEKKIPYEVSANQDSILVPSDQLYEIRLEMASQGLPLGGGVGFEIFDNAKLGMTEFVQNVNFQRALQGELSRTINSLEEVKGSRVHIVMGSKSLFSEDEEPATASVILKLRPGKTLSNGQVESIVHLVSSSVSGLKPDNVTVVDNYGKMLAGSKGGSGASDAPMSSNQLALQEKLEGGLESRVRSMLESALGPGNAIARVSVAMDFSKQEKTEERYHPDDKAVRSEQVFSESGGQSETDVGGVPGVLSNTSVGKGSQTGKSESKEGQSFNKHERTVNYEVSKVTSHTVETYPKITRVSTAVIVDGVHQHVEGKDGKGEWKYIPRSKEEMTKLEKIVKRAVNFDDARGDEIEVVNIPFNQMNSETDIVDGQEDSGWLSTVRQYCPSGKSMLLVGSLLFIFLFVIRPLLRWVTANTAVKQDMLVRLPKTVSEMENEYGSGHQPHKDEALQLISSDEEQSLKLMRNWLAREQT